ncbi:MAG: hypothetical protein EBX50_23285, partial [Chitinophagia bacterium]|nr:hypothetical protein [Chitinophagia bacterium]
MQNLRIVTVAVDSSSQITITFTDALTKNLVTSNVVIQSETPNVPEPKVLSIAVSDKKLVITCQPLTDLAGYAIVLKSVTNHPFTSVNGGAVILEDGVSNKYYIIGPIEPDNPV